MSPIVRRLLSTVFVLCVSLSVFAAATSASVQNTQGDRYRNLGGNDNGTRAYLAGTGHTNSTGEVSAAVSIQESIVSPQGMFQIGELKQSSNWADNCGGPGLTAVFVEYFLHSGGNGICPKTSGITAFGNGGLFAVAVGNNGWEAFWNSNSYYNPPALGFSSGWSIARNEAYVDPNSSGPSYAITWGPSGQVKWQFKTASVGYTTIDTSKVLVNDDLDNDFDNDWSMGGTPSPFNINFAGF